MKNKSEFSLDAIDLQNGSHKNPESGMCINEAVAYFAGEPHSDAPVCVDPVIRGFTLRLNDRLNNEKRQLLKPLIPLMIGTSGSKDDERLRRAMISEWYIKNLAIPRIDVSGNVELSSRFRALPDITSENIDLVRKEIRLIRGRALELRLDARDRLKSKIQSELKKRGLNANAAAADAAVAAVAADAAAANAAVAAANAAVAVDAAAADAVAAVAVDAVAVAVDAAVAAAVAAAAVVAVAVDAAAAARWENVYWTVHNKVYADVRKLIYNDRLPKYRKLFEDANLLGSAIDLVGRLCDVYRTEVPAQRSFYQGKKE